MSQDWELPTWMSSDLVSGSLANGNGADLEKVLKAQLYVFNLSAPLLPFPV
jgi:hypothetical protein